jgi:hypothetical protein
MLLCVNVNRSTSRSLESNLPSSSRTAWLHRALADHVVLVDWQGSIRDLEKGGPARVLKDAIYKVTMQGSRLL